MPREIIIKLTIKKDHVEYFRNSPPDSILHCFCEEFVYEEEDIFCDYEILSDSENSRNRYALYDPTEFDLISKDRATTVKINDGTPTRNRL